MPTPYILSYKMQLHASGRCTCYLPQIDDPSLEKIEILSAAYLLRENDERLLRKTKYGNDLAMIKLIFYITHLPINYNSLLTIFKYALDC